MSGMGFILHTTDFMAVLPPNRRLTEDTEWVIGLGAVELKESRYPLVAVSACLNHSWKNLDTLSSGAFGSQFLPPDVNTDPFPCLILSNKLMLIVS